MCEEILLDSSHIEVLMQSTSHMCKFLIHHRSRAFFKARDLSSGSIFVDQSTETFF